MDDALSRLREIERSVHDEFVANRRVLSLDEYFALFCAEPTRYARTAAAYVRDCLDYYGTYEVERPGGTSTRYALFDCPWETAQGDGGALHRVVGHEEAQGRLYRLLVNFLREGRVTRLVLLHGPNGSAKSSLIRCLADGLEHYSQTDEGAIYRFNWVFPSNRLSKKRLGFADGVPEGPVESYAHLDEADIDARLHGDLRDHPLLILPRDRRARLFAELRASGALAEDAQLGSYLTDGDLSPRSRAIADALLNAYHGDFQRVTQHIQVERFYFSRRYRVGVVTIEPQLHVDATMRQITMDQGLQALPPSLRTLNLYEAGGDLVDANRGLIEYNDLLKKPLDTYKYLLATCEKGTVALPNAILHLDVLFMASSNEKHLSAFKEYQDFSSFKGRMDLVKMPYLRNYRVEKDIYDEQVARGAMKGRVAPHASYVVALWAVLTRLKRPDPSRYPEALRPVIARLSPLEKAELYAGDREPAGLTPELSRLLWSVLPDLLAEGQEEDHYEGSFGASPREMKEVMLNALQNPRYQGSSPLGVLDELRELVKLRTVFEFLQREPDEGYHDHDAFIEQVQGRWLDRVDDEVRASMGLVSAEQYDDLVSRYIRHVSYSLKKEKVYDEAAGRMEEPDQRLMDQLEGIWKVGADRDAFRQNLIGRIGAWRIDFPGQPIEYRKLFPQLFHALEQDYYEQQRGTIRRLSEHVLAVLSEDPGHAQALAPGDRERAEASIERLEQEFGYTRPAAREALSALLSHRY
ncbi:MAG: serine protein kinase PrkA [Deltaproteobacteria bacterium]|nr:serine protein kinase PrkA [Deltaproteobacteria bacterium]MCB9785894.1 serine protein kinase PrkA [Deltaproteobacteria bacterium]